MTDDQVKLIQTSFAKLVPIADTAAALFYKKLFELNPALQPLFTGDMRVQGAKLMKMLAAVVSGLSNLDSLVPAVEDLGRRHVKYGVTEDMYDDVGAALIWTLEVGLTDAFTDDVKASWVLAFDTLKTTMCNAAYHKVA
jgi:nitric oxide dioxygenase